MYHYRARYYDPSNGRFISEDLISFEGGNNFYSYAANKPLSFKDPLGLAPDTDCMDCSGKPKQGFEVAKKCCRDADPMSSTDSPNPCSPCETYMAVNAAAMFRYGGMALGANWSEAVSPACTLTVRHKALLTVFATLIPSTRPHGQEICSLQGSRDSGGRWQELWDRSLGLKLEVACRARTEANCRVHSCTLRVRA